MSGFLSRPVLAVASPEDAAATAGAIEAHLADVGEITLVHVIEKGGGGLDKASVEQREEHAAKAFDAFRERLPDVDVATAIVYDTDVADGILAAARDHDASAIVFTPRGGNWLTGLLSGNVGDRLVAESEVPVLTLPEPGGGADS